MAALLKSKAPLPKVDLTDRFLEVYKYPRNCGALVVAEFAGGHRIGRIKDTARKLTMKEWKYILWYSIFSDKHVGDGYKSHGNVLHFSEKKSQTEFHFSGRGLFESFTKIGKIPGNKMEDENYVYYQLNIPAEVWSEIRTAHKEPPTTASHGCGPKGGWGT